MKTSELPIGSHVAINRNGSRDFRYEWLDEAYVIAHRPRGHKSSYWGNNHNHDTIGVMFVGRYESNKAYPLIRFEWIRPQAVIMTWDELTEAQDASKKRQAEADKKAKADRKARKARLDAIPAGVLEVLGDWTTEALVEGRYTTLSLNVELLEKLVAAAQQGHPAIRNASVQAEVEAALKLLA